jgi:tRNA (guanine37-N1)-methyltransferase
VTGMRIDIITIFPEYFVPLRVSLIGQAAARGDIEFGVHDLRNWAHDVHRTVDDTPYGGGPGMVMRPEPWGEALDEVVPATGAATGPGTGPATGPGTGAATGSAPRLILPAAGGTLFTQRTAEAYARERHLVFGCGRYEGIDARVSAEARSRMPVDEVSIGDYVLAGGEAAALVMIEAVCRLLPGVIGNAASAADDSFGPEGLLEGPVYTKPREWRGHQVPPVLLSGNHRAIARWRRDAALRRTAQARPELIARLPDSALDEQDRRILFEAGFPVHGEDMAH